MQLHRYFNTCLAAFYLSNPTVDIKWLQGLSNLESLVCKLWRQKIVIRLTEKKQKRGRKKGYIPLYSPFSDREYRDWSKQQHSRKIHWSHLKSDHQTKQNTFTFSPMKIVIHTFCSTSIDLMKQCWARARFSRPGVKIGKYNFIIS